MLSRLLASVCHPKGVLATFVTGPAGDVIHRHPENVGAGQNDLMAKASVRSWLAAEMANESVGENVPEEIWVEGKEGALFLRRLTQQHSIIVATTLPTPIGRVRHDINRIAPLVTELL